MARIEQWQAWPARVLWVALALVAAPTVADGLHGRSHAVTVVAAALCWAGWAVALAALLAPRTTSLTVVRVLVPAGLAVVSLAAIVGDDPTALDALAVGVAALATTASFAPWVAEEFVSGSAYGPEERSPLRTPPVVAVLAVATWSVVVVAAPLGPLLLAAGAWVAGALATVVGVGLAVAGCRSLHQLARRFTVVVPAGFVLHDPLTMPEPQLFPRTTIARLGPAVDERPDVGGSDGDGTADLTAGASGLALELDLREPVELLLRTGRGRSATRPSTRILFTPTRPRSVLDQATERRIPVG